MAKRMSNNDDVTEAVEVVDSVDQPAEVLDADEIALDDGGDAIEESAPAVDTGPNVYTVLLIVSSAAFLAATLVVLNALKHYSDPATWPLW